MMALSMTLQIDWLVVNETTRCSTRECTDLSVERRSRILTLYSNRRAWKLELTVDVDWSGSSKEIWFTHACTVAKRGMRVARLSPLTLRQTRATWNWERLRPAPSNRPCRFYRVNGYPTRRMRSRERLSCYQPDHMQSPFYSLITQPASGPLRVIWTVSSNGPS
jgi:antitoxin (DNA-binding transcriptional repressor) of toxin-antitoxin stability system